MKSVDDAPVSVDTAVIATAAAGAVVSSVKLMLALAVLPAISVSLTTTVWEPLAVGTV